jgi:hypothetical protein
MSIDPEINVRPLIHHHDVCGTQVTFNNVVAQSFSSSSANFTIIPPSQATFVNRAIRKHFRLQVVYTATQAGQGSAVIKSQYDALRSLVDLRMCQNTNILINGSGYPTATISDMIPDVLEHYSAVYVKDHPLGCPDMYQNYLAGLNAINNPLGSYENCGLGDMANKRGAFSVVSISNGATSATVVYDVFGWVHVHELLGLDCINKDGLIRIRQININDTFNLDPKYMLSHAVNSGLSAISAVVTILAADLMVKYITPSPELLPIGEIVYPHKRVDRQTYSYNAPLVAGASTTYTSPNIQLERVPRYVLLYVRENDSQKDFTCTDTFCAISNIAITAFGMAGILSTASQRELWLCSRDCGLLDSWSMFSGSAFSSSLVNVGSVGSVLCLQFGKHISLGQNDVTIGSAGSFNFQVQITFSNCNESKTMVQPTLYEVFIYDQDLVISDGGDCTFRLPVSDNSLVASGLIAGGGGQIVEVPWEGQVGGGFMDFIRGVNDFLKKHKIVSSVASMIPASVPFVGPAAQALGPVAKSLGYGGANMSKQALKEMIRRL